MLPKDEQDKFLASYFQIKDSLEKFAKYNIKVNWEESLDNFEKDELLEFLPIEIEEYSVSNCSDEYNHAVEVAAGRALVGTLICAELTVPILALGCEAYVLLDYQEELDQAQTNYYNCLNQ